MNTNQIDRRFGMSLSTLTLLLVSFACYGAGSDYYTEKQIYRARPDPNREMPFGHLGVTGVMVRVYRGVTVKVEKAVPGSPADGKFKKGEIITGINGVSLKGRNPFVTLGSALTNAEATNGQMIFDVASADGTSKRKATVRIPVLGSYSKTWPLNCDKSKKIIEQAAEFYADSSKFGIRFNERGIPGALACLFLRSTRDDKYVPPVKAYFDSFPKDVRRIGDHIWNNGYNGIACGEYYLRTGDKSVLPILQHYCDDAKHRQKFGCGWVHWGTGVSPGYVAGGLTNPAGAQVLTTLLLGKECGVHVDDDTLLGSLQYFYRFAGRGTVPYGDHRGEGGLGSNGKDGMIAAAMQIAAGSQGDVTIYEKARQYLGMSMLTSYPLLVKGHGDEGRGDGIWRSIITSYMLTKLRKPVAGWQPVGTPKLEDRIWRFTSFDPQVGKDRKHPREKKRFRTIQLPDELKGWYKVDYDDSRWERGRAPIGVCVHRAGRVSFKNNSDWGKGEFIVMRTTFEVDAVDCDSYRLSILAKQGFHVYLNGHKIHTYVWWKDMPHYRPIALEAGHTKHLKKGTNVLAAYGNVQYDKETHKPARQMDLFTQGLKMSDLK